MKEVSIIIISLVVVITGAKISENYLDETKHELLAKNEGLRSEIEKAKNDEENESSDLVNDIYNRWKEIEEKWSLIISHEELDLIELSIIGVKTSVLEEAYEDALVELEKSNYLIEHIKEREELLVKNIF